MGANEHRETRVLPGKQLLPHLLRKALLLDKHRQDLVYDEGQVLVDVLVEVVVAGEEIAVREREGAHREAAHVHRGAFAEQDAVRIDQEDAAVGEERAENHRGVDAGDPVERYGERVGLEELHGLAGAVVEALSVDDGRVAELRDGGDAAVLLNGGRAAL